MNVDVVVLGGGPAGAAAALALARGGRSVAVLTRPTGRRPRLGETVPPTVIRPLTRLGLWRTFLGEGHLPVPGTAVRWGSDRTYENEAILNPYGCGWHLDRSRFDAMLVAAARSTGALTWELPRGGVAEHDGCAWSVWVGGRTGAVRAPFLVDATGRAARTPVRCGVPRHREDRLIGLVRFGPAASAESRTVIESTATGWWYAAVLPGGTAVTALFTDADLLPTTAAGRERFWTEAAAGTQLVPGVICAEDTSALFAAAASPSALAGCAGRDWVAVGDAARTLDPLSGQGVTTAVESAVRAADAVLDPHPARALEEFSVQTAAAHRAHLATRLAHYGRERRWPGSPFWLRRHRRWSGVAHQPPGPDSR